MNEQLITKTEFAKLADVGKGAITKALHKGLRDALVGERINAAHSAAVAYLQRNDAATNAQPAPGIDPFYEAAIRLCNETGRFTQSNISRGLGIGVARAKRIFAMMQVAGTDKPGNVPPPPPGATTTAPPPPGKPRVVTGTEKKKQTKKSDALENINSEIEQGKTLHEIPADIKLFADMTLRELIQRYGTDTAFLDFLNATKRIEDINEKRLKNAATRGDLVSRLLIKKGVFDPLETLFNNLLEDGSKTMATRAVAMAGAGRTVDEVKIYIANTISSFIRPAKAKINRTIKNA